MYAQVLLAGALGALAALAYAGVGLSFARRDVSADARRAALDFSTWWFGLAAASFLQALQQAGAALGAPAAPWLGPFAEATQVAYVLAVSVALAGLLTFLWFVYRGAHRDGPIAAFYGSVFLAAAGSIVARGVAGFTLTPYGALVRYARDLPAQGGVDLAFFALFLVPQVGGTIAYLSLRRATADPVARRRILVVGCALLVWIGSSLLSAVVGVQFDARWLLVSQVVDLAAALTILGAYRSERLRIPSVTPGAAP
ncbi:MAG: hypothetical protein QOE90_1468 [Thermoplasmata archaeon]|nr:hypothetical protein [Thermoplasmata archaeon]